ncbi:kelch domain-containing protein [Pestalotiopsis sp. NC0098]|nr:kelch domain-containing protein [Pestalotiopsis sp. NC0098]
MGGSSIKKGRKSVFREIGLEDDWTEDIKNSLDSTDEKEFGRVTGVSLEEPTSPTSPTSPTGTNTETTCESDESREPKRWSSILHRVKRPQIKAASAAPPPSTTSMHRFTTIALLIAVILPTISYNNGRQKIESSGVDAGVIRNAPSVVLEDRADSPVDVCLRWAQQSALLNGTVYIYGGEAKSAGDQDTNTWNNNFLTLDLTKSWSTSSPPLTGLPQPSGPPAVALGYLWNDYNNLYLYGGEFADNPTATPEAVSTWQYSPASSSWTEFQNPQTSQGNYSTASGIAVQRAAEGAGISVPELGRSWYFGGHLDYLTTPDWSDQVARVYLKSMLEFTHPGYANNGVDSLQAVGAADGGVYRNITEGGIQNGTGFSERADGALVFVPGWGPSGIILGLGGGSTENNDTADEFASMSTIDVYDIETSEWYHQQTSGDTPNVRVNPCAVIFSAPDASSFNIYMYGGQNLLPVAGQTQYTDMYILTIPSFTWIKVDINSSNEPAARAGHTCHPRDGQMIVIGGYIGNTTDCDKPGIHNFDASSLQWKDSFTAGDHDADFDSDNTILAGSYGYQVPGAVQSVIGGSSDGGATATTPAVGPATGGPFLTGKPPVFTITASGSAATVTNSAPSPGSAATTSSRSGGLIAAGVIAGLLGLLAVYLGFCAWLYRRQVDAYKRHMAVANRYGGGSEGDDSVGLMAGAAGMREKLRKHRRGSSSAESADQFGWVGQMNEPKWHSTSDEPSPGSGTGGSSSGRHGPSEDRYPWSWGDGAGVGGAGGAGLSRMKSNATRSTASGGSVDGLLEGREPNFFSVVMGPRRALRVVNNRED